MASTIQDIELREITINPFKMHLSDAILATHLAKDAHIGSPEATRAVRAMLSRTAMAQAVFAFESAANCFAERIPRQKDFREKTEMWPALDKLDLFLLSVPGNPKLQRDDLKVKAMTELIKLRDRHVHPRLATYPVRRSETADISINIVMPDTSSVEIPPLGVAWSPEHATLAINIVLDFLRLFFQLTTIPEAGIRAILSDTVKCKDGLRATDVGNFNAALKLAPTIGVDVTFLLADS